MLRKTRKTLVMKTDRGPNEYIVVSGIPRLRVRHRATALVFYSALLSQI